MPTFAYRLGAYVFQMTSHKRRRTLLLYCICIAEQCEVLPSLACLRTLLDIFHDDLRGILNFLQFWLSVTVDREKGCKAIESGSPLFGHLEDSLDLCERAVGLQPFCSEYGVVSLFSPKGDGIDSEGCIELGTMVLRQIISAGLDEFVFLNWPTALVKGKGSNSADLDVLEAIAHLTESIAFEDVALTRKASFEVGTRCRKVAFIILKCVVQSNEECYDLECNHIDELVSAGTYLHLSNVLSLDQLTGACKPQFQLSISTKQRDDCLKQSHVVFKELEKNSAPGPTGLPMDSTFMSERLPYLHDLCAQENKNAEGKRDRRGRLVVR